VVKFLASAAATHCSCGKLDDRFKVNLMLHRPTIENDYTIRYCLHVLESAKKILRIFICFLAINRPVILPFGYNILTVIASITTSLVISLLINGIVIKIWHKVLPFIFLATNSSTINPLH